MEALIGTFYLILFLFMTAAYFIPAALAFYMDHPHKLFILIGNIVAGWTVVGWVGCLIWCFIDADQLPQSKSAANNGIDQLGKLHELKEKGVISQAEFDAKKAKLL